MEDKILFTSDGNKLISYLKTKEDESYTITSKQIGKYAFSSNNNLKTIIISSETATIEEGNQNYESYDGILFTKGRTTLWQYPGGKTDEYYYVDLETTAINQYAFSGNNYLKTIELHENVIFLYDNPFINNKELEDITVREDIDSTTICSTQTTIEKQGKEIGTKAYYIYEEISKYLFVYGKEGIIQNYNEQQPNTWESKNEEIERLKIKDIKQLGSYSFSRLKNIENIILPESVEVINEFAFSGNEHVKTIEIGSKVNSIGNNPFVNCTSLTNVIISQSNTNYKMEDKVLFTSDGNKLISYLKTKEGDSYTITAQQVGKYAFSSNDYLKEVTLSSQTVIEDNPFSNCASLTSINVQEGNTNYQSVDGILYSKEANTILSYPCGIEETTVFIENFVSSIGKEAFRGNQNIKVIVIPNDVNKLDDYSFGYFNSLTFILYQGSKHPECGVDVFENNKYLSNLLVSSNFVGVEICSKRVTMTT